MATASPRRAHARPSRPRSRCSGSRARRSPGTGSPDRSRPRRDSTSGSRPASTGCSTWRWRTGTSHRSTPSSRYNYWRPVTAIHNADTDGNPNTTADPTWTPLWKRLRFPTMTRRTAWRVGQPLPSSRDSSARTASRFTICSLTLPPGSTCDDPAPSTGPSPASPRPPTRTGTPAILVGIHFRKAVDEGIEHGRKIGERAVDRVMQPR